jgi:hypothetical protein
VCVCNPMKRGTCGVDGKPRRGDCASPVKWNPLTTCPLRCGSEVRALEVDLVVVPLPDRATLSGPSVAPLKPGWNASSAEHWLAVTLRPTYW